MRSGLQDLAGEVARLRAECGHFQRGLDFLERLSDGREHLTEAQEGEVTRINGIYAWSAKENLERATEDLKKLVARARRCRAPSGDLPCPMTVGPELKRWCSLMGQRVVNFSDLSGQQFEPGDQAVRLVVLEHPDLENAPAALEAFQSEVTPLLDGALDVAVVELHGLGDGQSQRLVVEVETFNKLAGVEPMPALLKQAPRATKVGRTKPPAGRVDYTSLQHAGTPHRGAVTSEEAAVVREHLDQVNARLQAAGCRLIDPTNPEHARRYGFATNEDIAP